MLWRRLRIAVFRVRHSRVPLGVRRAYWRCLGMKIGRGAKLLGRLHVTWPHAVSLGAGVTVEHEVFFKVDGPYSPTVAIQFSDRVYIGAGVEFNITELITVGSDTLIASGCRFVDHDHGHAKDGLLREQPCHAKAISIGRDCWIGCNSVILRGVQVGDGAIVGAGSVVTKSIPPNEIWAGAPAQKISERRGSEGPSNR